PAKIRAAEAAGQPLEEFDASRKAEFDRVKGNYPRASTWTQPDLFARSKLLRMEAIYETVYRTGCDSLHSGPAAIDAVMREPSDGAYELIFDRSAPTDGVVLVGAAWAYLHLLEE